METSEIIRNLRIKNNLSSKELSKILNISESSVSLYESGKRKPSLGLIIKIADYFSVSTDYLLGLSHKEYENNMAEKDFSMLIENIVYFLEKSDYIVYDGKMVSKTLTLILRNYLVGILENMKLLTTL
ncbi:helix-turn-helix domain-containing protein [Sedimentibacter sp. B4]|uniref:helix-turn-helix domain-containing protein n=1 Tax=Sedimentibacter sp. B4 TaxID=304766 RepID=UPI0002F53072|nr:helix-turn-helix transcriptional regulator [Sedimentibacter sp. B4]